MLPLVVAALERRGSLRRRTGRAKVLCGPWSSRSSSGMGQVSPPRRARRADAFQPKFASWAALGGSADELLTGHRR